MNFRVVFESHETYRVIDSENRTFPAEIAGRIRNGASLWPAVGDWIVGRPQQGDWILIESVCDRKSVLSRRDPGSSREQVLAANVDVLFIVTSANEDLSLNRLDRYITLARSGNVRPILVVNKIELCTNPGELLDEVAARFIDVDVHGVSALEGWNLEALIAYISQGQTAALVGSSGVGKSSLTNWFLGEARADVSSIRQADGRGRHTTTHRELHALESGGFVIDTPGLRQVGLLNESSLDESFPDIAELSSQCRFTDCQHQSEPGCAIHQGLKSGELDKSRWESFLKLQKELAYERRKTNKALQSEQKRKWAKIAVALREKKGRR